MVVHYVNRSMDLFIMEMGRMSRAMTMHNFIRVTHSLIVARSFLHCLPQSAQVLCINPMAEQRDKWTVIKKVKLSCG